MSTTNQFWLVKQEPEKYPWNQFLKEKKTHWDGVRNYQARNNLRKMKQGDWVFFYRSVVDPAVQGLCQVTREAYPDPTAQSGDWSVVDLKAVCTLNREVPLQEIKQDPSLSEIALIKQSRLSVMPLSRKEFYRILKLAKTNLDPS